jgi:predicted GNAT superfamily acetyltransferase
MTTPEHLPERRTAADLVHGARSSRLRDVDPGVDAAVQAADAAAQAAGVVVREVVDLPGLEAVARLLAGLWGRDANPPVSVELLRAFSKAGNYVVAAYDGEVVAGACVGFFHAPAEDALHSHIAGVAGDLAGRHVGFALKLHQRAWALMRGVSEVAWTFDPLVSRNAYFNLAKLGARPVEYLPNFYGEMLDTINGSGDTDRLLVSWRLTDPGVGRAARGEGQGADVRAELAAGAVVALGVSESGDPVPGDLTGEVSLVAVPPDIEELRLRRPAAAQAWRTAVRSVLTELFAEGASLTGFDKAGFYVVRRDPRRSS